MPDTSEPSLTDLREQVERQELLLRKRTLETAYNWYDDYVNPAEPLFDTPDFFFPLAGENLPFNLDNRLKGELLPVYITEYGLKILRDYSRWLAALNASSLRWCPGTFASPVTSTFTSPSATKYPSMASNDGVHRDIAKSQASRFFFRGSVSSKPVLG